VERVSWSLEIRHVTRYRYDRPVVASYNEARVTPVGTEDQVVVETGLEVQPATEVFCYRDYWGTVVHAFDVHEPHDDLVVSSHAVVGTGVQDGSAAAGGTCSWADLCEPRLLDRFYELLAPSALVGLDDLAGQAASLRRECASPSGAAGAAADWAHDQLEYTGGATDVSTSAAEAWRAGRGVCQDFAHLTLALLRATGIPARYVSGYFYPKDPAPVGASVVGESHAWVEAWTGRWQPIDPTNRVTVQERHVVVARGRDYADVAPLRGIYSGPPGSSTEVRVELVRRA
jgi:transglutaminase-like putative cysteine protease